jgi:hypothetical protein
LVGSAALNIADSFAVTPEAGHFGVQAVVMTGMSGPV